MKNKSDWKKGECNSCGSETLVIKTEHRFRQGEPEEIELCEICYTTGASKQYLYPSNHMDSSDVLRVIAEIGNIIRNDIKNHGKNI